jgi:hypothetical protein
MTPSQIRFGVRNLLWGILACWSGMRHDVFHVVEWLGGPAWAYKDKFLGPMHKTCAGLSCTCQAWTTSLCKIQTVLSTYGSCIVTAASAVPIHTHVPLMHACTPCALTFVEEQTCSYSEILGWRCFMSSEEKPRVHIVHICSCCLHGALQIRRCKSAQVSRSAGQGRPGAPLRKCLKMVWTVEASLRRESRKGTAQDQ